MHNFIVSMLVYALELFILIRFMNSTLNTKKEHVHPVIFYLIFGAAELALSGCRHYQLTHFTYYNHISATIISFLIVFALTFVYNNNLSERIFISITFQLFKAASEWFFTYVAIHINPAVLNGNKAVLATKIGPLIILLILTFIFGAIKDKNHNNDNQYSIMLLFIPSITLVILIFLPFEPISSSYTTLLMFILTAFNIGNYILIEYTFRTAKISYEYDQMQRQIELQKEKYLQLSTSYKNTRAIVHDTKKHYMTIQSFISSKDYDKLSGYLYTACNELETTYTRYNTGNLVIDSLLTNYKSMSDHAGITFEDDLCVDEHRVPVEDYDLSIILGNILDNCINATIASSGLNRFIYIQILTDEHSKFIIHTKNSYNTINNADSTHNMEHGFGIRNIINIVEKYNGMHKFIPGDVYEVLIVIPIMDKPIHK